MIQQTRKRETEDDYIRLTRYIHKTPFLLRELRNNKNDIDRQRELLVSNGAVFLGNVMSSYDGLVKDITNHILSQDKTISKRKITQVNISKPIKKTTLIKIKQRQKSGIIYERAKPKRFRKRELIFLQNNQDMPNKDLVSTYNNY